jgi:hypothetical protein
MLTPQKRDFYHNLYHLLNSQRPVRIITILILFIDYAFVRSQEILVVDFLTKNRNTLVKLSMVPEKRYHSYVISNGLEKRIKEGDGSSF